MKRTLPLVALVSDFGATDVFVAAMKAVILSYAPNTQFLDVTHMVPAHDVFSGLRALEHIAPFLPEGTVTLGVVDPGVGSKRRALIVECDSRYYIGPDNGLFSPFIKESSTVVWANQNRFWRPRVSRTFHGRDVFAPLAGHILSGVHLLELGEPVRDAVIYKPPPAIRNGDYLEGQVVAVDHFGNLATNVKMSDVHPPAEVEVGGERVPLVEFYEQVPYGKTVALGDSLGYLEIAVNQGRATDVLGLKKGAPVRVRIS